MLCSLDNCLLLMASSCIIDEIVTELLTGVFNHLVLVAHFSQFARPFIFKFISKVKNIIIIKSVYCTFTTYSCLHQMCLYSIWFLLGCVSHFFTNAFFCNLNLEIFLFFNFIIMIIDIIYVAFSSSVQLCKSRRLLLSDYMRHLKLSLFVGHCN